MMNSSAPFTGELLEQRYRLLSIVGQGGMGVVYLAEDIRLERKCAVKLLAPHFTPDSSAVERFRREAQITASIRHQNVVDIFDFGTTPAGTIFIVMEHLAGEGLDRTLQREGPLPWRRVRRIVLQVCAALAAVHERGVIHRDMKLSNCFRVGCSDDRVKLLDFGIAKPAREYFDDITPLTHPGGMLGTPEYMAPEQILGGRFDHRVDIWAVGVMMYRMLTGQLPFRGQDALGTLYMITTVAPPSMGHVAPELAIADAVEAIVRRALERDVGQRFSSATELASAIEAVAETVGRPSRAREPADDTNTLVRPRALHRASAAVLAFAGSAPTPSPPTAGVPFELRVLWSPKHTPTAQALALFNVVRAVVVSMVLSPVRAFASVRSMTSALRGRVFSFRDQPRSFAPHPVAPARAPAASSHGRPPPPTRRGPPGPPHQPGPPGEPWALDARWRDISADALIEFLPRKLRADAGAIAATLAASFRQFRGIDKQTVQLRGDADEHRLLYVKCEHYCIFFSDQTPDRTERLGTTTFMERMASIEPLIWALNKNVRKTIVIVTNSDRVGEGVFLNIQGYRREHDIYIAPILVSEIRHAERRELRRLLLTQRFNELHPDGERLFPCEPATRAEALVGHSDFVARCSTFLRAPGPALLVVRALPFFGKSSIARAALAECQPIRAGAELSIGGFAGPHLHGDILLAEGLDLDALLADPAVDGAIGDHLQRKMKVLLAVSRADVARLDRLRATFGRIVGLRIEQFVVPRPGYEDFSRGIQVQCAARNIRLIHGAMRTLYSLAGGRIGWANKILNNAVEVLLSSPSRAAPRRRFGHPMSLLKILPMTAQELRQGAVRLATSAEFCARLGPCFAPIELQILRNLASERVTQAQLIAALQLQGFSPAETMQAIQELRDSDVIERRGRLFLSVGLLAHWIQLQAEEADDATAAARIPRSDMLVPSVDQQANPEAGPEANDAAACVDEPETATLLQTSASPPQTAAARELRKDQGETVAGVTSRYQRFSPNPHQRLCELLLGCFDEQELRRFVNEIPAASGTISRSSFLPGLGVSFADLVGASAHLLVREGVLHEAFAQLKAVRPNRLAQIELVEASFLPLRGEMDASIQQ